MGRNKSKEFHILKNKIQGKLEGWRSRLLSQDGKATLIKSVALAMPTYTMLTFRIPKSVCLDLDSIARRFWWGAKKATVSYLVLKSWDKLCKPKDNGGLGFSKFWDINTALLAKIGWMDGG